MITKLTLGIQISQCSEIWDLLSVNAKAKRPIHTPTTSRSLLVQSLQIQPYNNPNLKPEKNHQALYLTIKLIHQMDQKNRIPLHAY